MRFLRVVAVAVCTYAFVSCSSPQGSQSRDDTPENRRAAAEAYLRAVPAEDMMRDAAEKIAETLPEAKRAAFIRAMTQELDMSQLTTAMTNSLVKWFSVDELDALTRFYSSPDGKSVMTKFGSYMADLMPVIQAEATKAFAKAEESK